MLSELISIIDKRAKAAGFTSTDDGKLLLVNNEIWPDAAIDNQLFYWCSDFASILLVEVSCMTCAEARKISKLAETYLDAALVEREKNGCVIDGYLVLALPEINNDLKAFMVEVEGDTRFVRKHVVFANSGKWERYERITPLGLLSSYDQVQNSEFIPDSDSSSQLLKLLAKLGSTELARRHGREWDLNE